MSSRSHFARTLTAMAFGFAACVLGQAVYAQVDDPKQSIVDDVAFHNYLDSWLAANRDGLVTLASNTSGEFGAAVAALVDLNGRLGTFEEVKSFRRWPSDDDLVDLLIPLASGDNIELRRESTLVLTNVVDNTNVCHIIAKLAREGATTSVSGRYNLLLVVATVSTYARSDTAVWMTALARKLRNLGDTINGQPKTSFVLASIEVAAYGAQNSPSNTRLADENGRKSDGCKNLLPTEIVTPPAAK